MTCSSSTRLRPGSPAAPATRRHSPLWLSDRRVALSLRLTTSPATVVAPPLENLAREAQVSHATVHRVDDILAEWNAKVARPVLRTPGEAARDETISGLRKHLREARAEITQLNGKLDALATVTTNLYHENLALKRRDNDRRLAPLPTSE